MALAAHSTGPCKKKPVQRQKEGWWRESVILQVASASYHRRRRPGKKALSVHDVFDLGAHAHRWPNSDGRSRVCVCYWVTCHAAYAAVRRTDTHLDYVPDMGICAIHAGLPVPS